MSTPAKPNTSSAKKKKKSDEVVEGGGTDLFATLVPEADPEDDAEADPPRTPDVRRYFDTEAKEAREVEPKAKVKSGSTKKKSQLVIVDDDNNSQPPPDVVAHNEVATIEVKNIYMYIYFFV